jgi:hypothetical protein
MRRLLFSVLLAGLVIFIILALIPHKLPEREVVGAALCECGSLTLQACERSGKIDFDTAEAACAAEGSRRQNRPYSLVRVNPGSNVSGFGGIYLVSSDEQHAKILVINYVDPKRANSYLVDGTTQQDITGAEAWGIIAKGVVREQAVFRWVGDHGTPSQE